MFFQLYNMHYISISLMINWTYQVPISTYQSRHLFRWFSVSNNYQKVPTDDIIWVVLIPMSIFYSHTWEAYLERSQASKIKLSEKIDNSWKPLTIFRKSLLDDWALNALLNFLFPLNPARNYMFMVNNRNTRNMFKVNNKDIRTTPHFVLVFLLLTLSR